MSKKSVLSAALALALGSAPVFAQNSPAPAPAPGPDSTTPKPLAFHPPGVSGGILPIRVGGGSRGSSNEGFSLIALVPDGVVYTSQGQPNLYWYQSGVASHPCEITITEPRKSQPLIVLRSDAGVPAGIHAVHLSKLNVQLAPDVLYTWSVAMVVDPQYPSQDVIASGLIERKDPTAAITAQLSSSSDRDKPSIYAQNGYWYDALQILSEQIDHDSANAGLRSMRASLLKQVGLDGDIIESGSAKHG